MGHIFRALFRHVFPISHHAEQSHVGLDWCQSDERETRLTNVESRSLQRAFTVRKNVQPRLGRSEIHKRRAILRVNSMATCIYQYVVSVTVQCFFVLSSGRVSLDGRLLERPALHNARAAAPHEIGDMLNAGRSDCDGCGQVAVFI